MRIAYILPVHRSPTQVERLLGRLAGPEASFVLHVDRRTAPDDTRAFAKLAERIPAVTFVEPHACYWGGFGMVRAALKGIRHVVATAVPFDYAILLSGQDYPLRPTQGIVERLAAADGASLIECFPLPRSDGWGPRGGLDRIEDWHLIRRRALHLRLPRARRVPGGRAAFGGGAWWCLPRPVVEHVDAVVRAEPELVRFFEHVLHPSELFFQTLIMGSPFADTVLQDNARHIEWDGGPNPVVLTAPAFEQLRSSPKLFARKFDVDVDAEILDLLDEQADREASGVAG